MKKGVVVLGSTGSIGVATLEAIESQQDDFVVLGLACKGNLDLFARQIEKHRPRYAYAEQGSSSIAALDGTRWFEGADGLKEMVRTEAPIIVNALPGSTGLEPSIEALRQGKTLALANKESLVMAGRLLKGLLARGQGRLLPIDSEHSALFQLLEPLKREEVKSLIITASGGPFRGRSTEELEQVSPEEALNHPTWKMGQKVTLDSATLMNKGLEVIEARWLFDVSHDRIEVLVHPESIVHGMVELVDGSLLACLSYPDMRIPISYALNEGRRPIPFGKVDLAKTGSLTFHRPDTERFPSLRLAYEALGAGDSAVICLNAANDVASSAFMEGSIRFVDIAAVVGDTIAHHSPVPVVEDADTIWELHRWAAQHAGEKIRSLNG